MRNSLEIWQPRWHDRKVLIACHKVAANANEHVVKFSKAPTLTDDYIISTSRLVQYPKETNGTVQCYAVPLNDFTVERRAS